MAIEVVGFLSGVGVVCGAGLLLLRLELRNAVRAAYGRKAGVKPSENALIWPSR